MIYILTGPVRTGKTTALKNWVASYPAMHFGGVLSPDVDGKRVFYHIPTGRQIPFETVPTSDKQNTIKIGRFRFLKSAFTEARRLLINDAKGGCDFLVIDEIGKLEMQNLGLEPAANKIISIFSAGKMNGNLIMVVRDYLLEAAVEKFGLQNRSYQLIRSPSEIPL